jgi:hypothetical protein
MKNEKCKMKKAKYTPPNREQSIAALTGVSYP